MNRLLLVFSMSVSGLIGCTAAPMGGIGDQSATSQSHLDGEEMPAIRVVGGRLQIPRGSHFFAIQYKENASKTGTFHLRATDDLSVLERGMKTRVFVPATMSEGKGWFSCQRGTNVLTACNQLRQIPVRVDFFGNLHPSPPKEEASPFLIENGSLVAEKDRAYLVSTALSEICPIISVNEREALRIETFSGNRPGLAYQPIADCQEFPSPCTPCNRNGQCDWMSNAASSGGIEDTSHCHPPPDGGTDGG